MGVIRTIVVVPIIVMCAVYYKVVIRAIAINDVLQCIFTSLADSVKRANQFSLWERPCTIHKCEQQKNQIITLQNPSANNCNLLFSQNKYFLNMSDFNR